MAYEKISIRDFENAWLNKDYSKVSEEEFKTAYYEYVDTTGAYKNDNFDKVAYIRLLENRIITIAKFIQAQTLFFEEFHQPYTEAFEIVEEFGYQLKWKGDRDNFLDQLISMKVQESSIESELKICVNEYNELQKNQPSQPEQTEREKRENWMKSCNSLVKLGYTIDKDRMMMEEISYIIKYEKEQAFKNG